MDLIHGEGIGNFGMTPEKAGEQFLEIVPGIISAIRDMIMNDEVPPATKVALFNIVLERALGKPEVPVHVSTDEERVRAAEAQLAQIVQEMQGLMEDE